MMVRRCLIELYVERNPDATVAQVLGRFLLDPNDPEIRAVVAEVMGQEAEA